MEEFWEVYDKFRRKTGRTIKRNSEERLKNGEYHLVVTGIIVNSNNQILISKRTNKKTLYPNLWECSGGSAKVGESSHYAIKREIYEELGIYFKENEGEFLGTIQQNDYFRDVWKFCKNIEEEQIEFNEIEVSDVKWVTEDEYKDMYQKGQIVPTGNTIIDLLKKERECEER